MDALIIVDVQKDFCPGGALPVPEGDKVVGPLSRLVEHGRIHGWAMFASRDWHPARMAKHFETWPAHCVQGTRGAEFHDGLDLETVLVVSKGRDPDANAYSVFSEGAVVEQPFKTTTRGFADSLRSRSIDTLYVGGLATDYCVRATVLDAVANAFKVKLVIDACRAINTRPSDDVAAIIEMKNAGAGLTTVDEITRA